MRAQNPALRRKLATLAAISFVLCSLSVRAREADVAAPSVTPDAALQALRDGNERYVSSRLEAKDFPKERHALTAGQSPYAIILSCSDSRVPPELLFDESLGKLFIARVAGNVADPAVLGSIEYAATHLNVTLLVVMGHDSCGAVQAAIDGGKAPANVASIVKVIAPAAKLAKAKKLDAAATADAAVRANVRLQMKAATERSTVIRDYAARKKLRIVGALYHLESGEVEWLD
jgi:carbonic anhydrase